MNTMKDKGVIIEYGIMSSKFKVVANNKYTAYCTMCLHYQHNSHMIAIYTDEFKEDSWINPSGAISERLDEIFKEHESFDKYFESNIEEVKKAYKSIERLS